MFQKYKTLCFGCLKINGVLRLQTSNIQSRCIGTLSKAEVKERMSRLFDEEKKRQRGEVGRIEKILVKYTSAIEETTLAMNKHLSTPHDCAKHITEGVSKTSAIALVNGQPWDMHNPLTSDCALEFVTLLSPSNIIVNTAFWRTCSFLLGAVIDSSFRSCIMVHLHSFPPPMIQTGSFVYNVNIEMQEWNPSPLELRALSAQAVKLSNQELPIESITTTEDVACDIFQHNPFKLQQIPDIASRNDNKVTLYRVGNHVDISRGPMVGNTSHIGRFTVAGVHKIHTPDRVNIYRFQGVALPKGIFLNPFAYSQLVNRATKLNKAEWAPQSMLDNLCEDPMEISDSPIRQTAHKHM